VTRNLFANISLLSVPFRFSPLSCTISSINLFSIPSICLYVPPSPTLSLSVFTVFPSPSWSSFTFCASALCQLFAFHFLHVTSPFRFAFHQLLLKGVPLLQPLPPVPAFFMYQFYSLLEFFLVNCFHRGAVSCCLSVSTIVSKDI